MTEQPLDPAAIMAAHESHVWPNTRGCLYADMETDKPETQRCLPYRLAAALAAAQEREQRVLREHSHGEGCPVTRGPYAAVGKPQPVRKPCNCWRAALAGEGA